MGSITTRKSKSGPRYTALVRVKRDGKIVHSEAQTFERRAVAAAWIKQRETELSAPGALTPREDPPLKDAIGRYIESFEQGIGRTKAQCLRTIAASGLGTVRCSKVDSVALVEFVQGIDAQPQTRDNYLSHLAAVFTIARPAWGIPLDKQQVDDARMVLRKLGATSRSRKRDRRPTVEELGAILGYYLEMDARGRAAIPMLQIIPFALYSTRRQEEICRITWEDYQGDRVLVRDMKHPGQKIGNDTWCDLPPEARRIIDAMPKGTGRIFPYNHRSVSASFTKACKFLKIDDLHFHDLRHEGASRLFEMGWNIPHVAAVTGHRSWQSLKRYAHLRQAGDRWAGWQWLESVAAMPTA
ncbi:site-specific integrase [Paraburkholderia sp. BL10I2N1]|uniref:site-specific integrase n=1 Tax=Paraburkholderia sp. BL10I2N1 TaxID=1938796 RepID=UPI00105C1092|nr:site-specific integrase [Paraburkholderia sp. BL10I2N1]TDN70391.1 phage integrase family protein [Paraburkholderia sp. BL10I2N1]